MFKEELRHALDLIVQMGTVGEEELARVQGLFHIPKLIRWVGIRQLHREQEGDTTEIEQAGSPLPSNDLLHPQDEFD